MTNSLSTSLLKRIKSSFSSAKGGTVASLRHIFRYVEWAILSAYAMTNLLAIRGGIETRSILEGFAFLAIWTLFSLVFPIDRPLWQRRIYLSVEILLVLVARCLDWNYDILLYLFIAKGCFLLNRREIGLTILGAGVGWVMPLLWLVPKAEVDVRNSLEVLRYHPQQFLLSAMVATTSNYLACSVFVVLMSFLMIAERNSRHKAEQLAQEVERLAATVERTRIARDLHDSLGHTLTSLQIQLAIAQRFRHRNLDRTSQAINDAKHLADQCIEDISHAIQTLRQPNLDLNQAIAALFEDARRHTRFEVDWQIEIPPLPVVVSHHLYCLVKEGLVNIQKHADATQVRFLGKCHNDEIWLELEDNGKGFDPEQEYPGCGLKGMQERVVALNGQFRIESRIGQGARIQVVIPISSDHDSITHR